MKCDKDVTDSKRRGERATREGGGWEECPICDGSEQL
jgi:hypothetical protein